MGNEERLTTDFSDGHGWLSILIMILIVILIEKKGGIDQKKHIRLHRRFTA